MGDGGTRQPVERKLGEARVHGFSSAYSLEQSARAASLKRAGDAPAETRVFIDFVVERFRSSGFAGLVDGR